MLDDRHQLVVSGPENDEVLTEIRRLLAKVDAMKQQREALEKQIRDDVMKDDITTILLATDAPLEVCIYIDMYIEREEKILKCRFL